MCISNGSINLALQVFLFKFSWQILQLLGMKLMLRVFLLLSLNFIIHLAFGKMCITTGGIQLIPPIIIIQIFDLEICNASFNLIR
jgi:hypothetical protein